MQQYDGRRNKNICPGLVMRMIVQRGPEHQRYAFTEYVRYAILKIRKLQYDAIVYVMGMMGMRRDFCLCAIFLPVGGHRARGFAVHFRLQHLLVHALDSRDGDALTRPVIVDRKGPSPCKFNSRCTRLRWTYQRRSSSSSLSRVSARMKLPIAMSSTLRIFTIASF